MAHVWHGFQRFGKKDGEYRRNINNINVLRRSARVGTGSEHMRNTSGTGAERPETLLHRSIPIKSLFPYTYVGSSKILRFAIFRSFAPLYLIYFWISKTYH